MDFDYRQSKLGFSSSLGEGLLVAMHPIRHTNP